MATTTTKTRGRKKGQKNAPLTEKEKQVKKLITYLSFDGLISIQTIIKTMIDEQKKQQVEIYKKKIDELTKMT